MKNLIAAVIAVAAMLFVVDVQDAEAGWCHHRRAQACSVAPAVRVERQRALFVYRRPLRNAAVAVGAGVARVGVGVARVVTGNGPIARRVRARRRGW